MSRRRYILPLVWLVVLLLAAAWAFVAPRLSVPDASGHHAAVVVVYTAQRGFAFLAPFAVFTAAYAIIDAWLQLSYRRWLAWAQLVLSVIGGAAPTIATQVVMARASGANLTTAFGALHVVWSVGYFASLGGFLCFAAVLISVVIRAWRKPKNQGGVN